jgi:phage recombination protein Bet
MSLPDVRGTTTLDLREIRQDTPISIECGDGVITMSCQNVLDWVAPGAPLQDAMRFLMVCRNARLNPLLGEAFLLPMGKQDTKFQVVFPKSAYLKRAQENPAYDGHESGITIWAGGNFHDVEGLIRPPIDRVVVIGGWAKVWRKGVERPTYKRVSLDEYRKGTHIWTAIPNTMIAKVALVAALREAFNLSDSYDESEADHELPRIPDHALATQPGLVRPQFPPSSQPAKAEDVVIDVQATEPTSYRLNDTIGYACPSLVISVNRLIDDAGMSDENVHAMLARRNVERVEDLTVKQAEEIVIRLEAIARESQATEVFGQPPTQPESIVLAQPAESVVLPEVSRRGEPAEATS